MLQNIGIYEKLKILTKGATARIIATRIVRGLYDWMGTLSFPIELSSFISWCVARFQNENNLELRIICTAVKYHKEV